MNLLKLAFKSKHIWHILDAIDHEILHHCFHPYLCNLIAKNDDKCNNEECEYCIHCSKYWKDLLNE